MRALQFFDFLVFGDIHSEFIIDLNNRSREEIPGGSALYAAGGLRNWNDRVGIVAHTHPCQKNDLAVIQSTHQIDTEGVHFSNEEQENRRFFGYSTPFEVVTENPVAYYADRKLVFPRNLIGFTGEKTGETTSQEPKFLPEDIPSRYQNASAALLCRAGLMTHLQLSSMLLNLTTTTLLIQSDPSYMKLQYYETLPVLLKDLTFFVTSIVQLRKLFQNRTQDIWEMAACLSDYGCEMLVIHDGKFGFYVYSRALKKRYHAPMYPVEVVDPTGMMESFCGGLLAGLKIKHDPQEALAYGIVSASMTLEGSGPFYGMECLQGLGEQRIGFALETVKEL